MKKLIVAAFVALALMASCGGGGKSLKTDVDTLAYALGIELGTRLKMTDSTLNPNIVAKAIIDVYNDRADMTYDQARQAQQEYFTVKLPVRAQAAADEYMAKIEKEENATKTSSGLLYEVMAPGIMGSAAVNDDDVVKVKYTGYLKDGQMFDTSGDDEVEFPLNQVISGWTEGMKLVGPGGKIRLWIPPHLGYGPYGQGGIGPNEPLMFDVDLVSVTPASEAAAQ